MLLVSELMKTGRSGVEWFPRSKSVTCKYAYLCLFVHVHHRSLPHAHLYAPSLSLSLYLFKSPSIPISISMPISISNVRDRYLCICSVFCRTQKISVIVSASECPSCTRQQTREACRRKRTGIHIRRFPVLCEKKSDRSPVERQAS